MLVIKYTIMFLLLIFSAYYDLDSRKIPNKFVFTGIFIGLLWSNSLKEFFMKLVALIFLFFFGMLHLLSMGDLKLWMMIAMFIGLENSCYSIGLAAFLLIIRELIIHYDTSVRVFKIAFKDILQQRRIRVFEQEGFPFAPYILIGTFIIWFLRIGRYIP